jgi:hypothetical protein
MSMQYVTLLCQLSRILNSDWNKLSFFTEIQLQYDHRKFLLEHDILVGMHAPVSYKFTLQSECKWPW